MIKAHFIFHIIINGISSRILSKLQAFIFNLIHSFEYYLLFELEGLNYFHMLLILSALNSISQFQCLQNVHINE